MVEVDENIGLLFFSLLIILFFIFFYIQIMDFYPIMDCECDITPMRG